MHMFFLTEIFLGLPFCCCDKITEVIMHVLQAKVGIKSMKKRFASACRQVVVSNCTAINII